MSDFTIRAVEKTIDEYEISDKVKANAKRINGQIAASVHTCRCERRVMYMWFLVYNGHLEAGEKPNPFTIAKMVGGNLNASHMRLAEKQFSFPRTAYHLRDSNGTPIESIHDYAKRIGLQEMIVEKLEGICRKWETANTDYYKNSSPQVIAASVIKYYMQCNGLKFDMEIFDLRPEQLNLEEIIRIDNNS